MKKLKIIILAGGFGTRLWPLSRKTSPKQFCKLKELAGKSLFQLTLERAISITDEKNIFVVTAKEVLFHSEVQSKELGIELGKNNYIIQPSMKETLPIISLSVRIAGDGIILILPSDHIIPDINLFKKTILNTAFNLGDNIGIFGVTPTKAETGYGYIEVENNKEDISKVLKFREKPNLEKAEKYIKKGFLWNSGIFLFDSKIFFNELKEANRKMYDLILNKNLTNDEIFEQIETVSIDYGLLEKTKNIICSKLDLYWNDLGSFDSIGEYISEFNIVNPKVIVEGKTKNNIVLTENRNKEIALIDIEDLIIIDHEDVLLISKKGSSQKVKEVIGRSKNLIGATEYRPWGKFRILEEGTGYKTKNLTVLPGKKLSYQMHYHRSEHWVVVSGTAKATIGDKEIILAKGESIFVPVGTKHRLENPGKTILVIIESQIGDYLQEDDIVRYEDDFGRK